MVGKFEGGWCVAKIENVVLPVAIMIGGLRRRKIHLKIDGVAHH